MWVISEMVEHACEVKQIPIGVIPFGTGNDLSRVLRTYVYFPENTSLHFTCYSVERFVFTSDWGGCVSNGFIGKNLEGLKSMILKWIEAKVQPFDIWEVHMHLRQVR